MARLRAIKPVSFRQEDLPLLKAAEELAKSEGKDFSVLVRDILAEYVKKHGSGNPSYKLEQFGEPQFRALPTPWADPTLDKLHSVSSEDAKFMVAQMAKWYPELQRKAKGD